MHEPAVHLADWLAHPAGHVLDVGVGAPWSIALAQADPSCHVTALGLPEALVTWQAVAGASLQSRFSFLPGDMFTVPLEPQFNLVVLGYICHLVRCRNQPHAAATAPARPLARWHGGTAARRHGGTAASIDILPAR